MNTNEYQMAVEPDDCKNEKGRMLYIFDKEWTNSKIARKFFARKKYAKKQVVSGNFWQKWNIPIFTYFIARKNNKKL